MVGFWCFGIVAPAAAATVCLGLPDRPVIRRHCRCVDSEAEG